MDNQTSPLSPVAPSVQPPATSMPAPQPQTPSPVVPLTIPELPHGPEKLLTASTPVAHKTSWGALIGIIIILLVLVVGALYFWGAKLAQQDAETNAISTETMEEIGTEEMLYEEGTAESATEIEGAINIEESVPEKVYDGGSSNDYGF